jgi:hypothetical protein
MKESAALPSEAAHSQVLAHWTDLQARLMLVIEEVGASDLQEHLRSQGVRRTGTLANNLAKELECAKAMAELMGVIVTPALRPPSAAFHFLPAVSGDRCKRVK